MTMVWTEKPESTAIQEQSFKETIYLYQHPRILHCRFLLNLAHDDSFWVAGGKGGEVGPAEGVHFERYSGR
jgi:hypothetical protein